MRKFFALGLVALLLLEFSGCSPEWKRKFIRKKKRVHTEQPILVLHPDHKAMYSPAFRYQERFAYRKSWHLELLTSLGEIKKRDLKYLQGTIGELRSMVELIEGPPAKRLKEIIVELMDLEESWSKRPSASWRASPLAKSRLEQLDREINKKLHFSKVKEYIISDPALEEDQVPQADAAGSPPTS